MKSYRFNSVSFTSTGKIPLLVACPRNKADGHIVVEAEGTPVSERLPYVRLIDSNALSIFVNDVPAFQREYGDISPRDCSRLLGLLRLSQGLKTSDRTAYKWAFEHLTNATASPEALFDQMALERQPEVELVKYLARGLRRVELVIWWKEVGRGQVFDVGLRCPDATAALYALAAISIVGGGGGIGACLRCGTAFVRQRRTRKFCSDKCRYDMHMSRSARRPRRQETRRN
jgi:hypothetical protein